MDIYLLPKPHLLPRVHERLVPYFESPAPVSVDDDAELKSISSRLVRWKQKIYESYRTLYDRFPLHERLCTLLGSADSIRVYYPDSLKPEDARYAFEHFLGHQIFNHRFWMTGNGILASLGTLLTPIPGPNVFFLYPAVRGYSHYRARAGALRAASIEILFIPSKILGDFLASIHHKPRSKVLPFLEPLAANMGLPRLPDYYREVILHKHP